jgi:hypothetical protein
VVRVPGETVEGRAAYARAHIRLRVRGDQRAALAEGRATAYWAGTVEVPLAELLDRK